MVWCDVGTVRRYLSCWRETRNGIHVQHALGGQDGLRWAGRTVSRGHGIDLFLPRQFHLGEGSTHAQVLSFARPDRPRMRTALRELYLFHKRYNMERCQHLRIQETVGGRWPCLNTRGGKRRRNAVVLRSAPAASCSRQLMSAWRSSRSDESCSALLLWAPNGATRVRYAQMIDSSAPAHDRSCRQRPCRKHEQRK